MSASRTRADRLVDEFIEGATRSDDSGYNVRAGLAAVLTHLVDTEADPESFGAVPPQTLENLADALTAHDHPSLPEEAQQ
ncbi:MAG: hypothetical protein VKN56_08530 [Cyanobacteriota bacterium]|nr:hypothetical protein [Cyanobacteriota bacterium]